MKIFLKKLTVNSSGYTLVEILVSTAIIAILAGVILANLHFGGQKNDLATAAQQLASNIRLAQNYALGLKNYNGSFPSGGWGIYMRSQNPNNNQYIICADTDEERDCDIDEYFNTIKMPGYDGSNPQTARVKITDVSTPGNNLWVYYIPPNPDILICDDPSSPTGCDNDQVTIELTQVATGQTKRVIINKFGLVDVDD